MVFRLNGGGEVTALGAVDVPDVVGVVGVAPPSVGVPGVVVEPGAMTGEKMPPMA
jgi:hypothetical protein